jgi:hypothetical protein
MLPPKCIKIRQGDQNHVHAIRVLLLALPTTKALKDIVFRFINREYSSLRDFWPILGNNNNNRSIFIQGFLKDDIFGFC